MAYNSLPGASSTGRLRGRVTAIERDIDQLKSMRAPGVLTSVTTRGVFQSAKPTQAAARGSSPATTLIPRWA